MQEVVAADAVFTCILAWEGERHLSSCDGLSLLRSVIERSRLDDRTPWGKREEIGLELLRTSRRAG